MIDLYRAILLMFVCFCAGFVACFAWIFWLYATDRIGYVHRKDIQEMRFLYDKSLNKRV